MTYACEMFGKGRAQGGILGVRSSFNKTALKETSFNLLRISGAERAGSLRSIGLI
jgi:hypothetical protein